ncbi:Pc20g03730 [Penicillium rubens Wisconsin 54-1255]|uniref:Pc20g03730 protein n=2 Tax=Penicillium chrysogenum species complex TaxID=254878 RepID=B6HGT6_PENRW|nr:Pc20g03730 [Penicillium rubens Wisconsin 54-1255]
MAGSAEFGGPPRQLRPDQVPLLLNTIDKLRSIGVGEHVELPQMIICGSKANAKRSVIESISRIRFPVRKDFHNGFVTEITLRRHATTRFQVSVEPGPSSSKSQLDIQELKGSMVTAPNAEQSVSLIEKATGFVKPSLEDGFSEDVMRVELSGPDQPNLTLIDIPRLYFTEGIDDENKDKCAGHLQIEKYVRNPRTIILAVVSAKIDICAQKINDFADKYDRGRSRILGIITHLDTLEESSDEEKLWQMAVKEEISQQPLGLHLVWTRSSESRDVPDEQRDQKEKEFLERGDWKTVPRESVGTDNLRSRLSTLFVNHVQSSLPRLISEINQRTRKIQSNMSKLRTPRETIHQQKALLVNLGSDFHRITSQALTGMYIDDFFDTRVDDDQPTTRDPRRLRAMIRALNEDFADVMDIAGCRQFIHGVNNQVTSLLNPCNPYANIRQPVHKSRMEFELDVLEIMCRDRGLEFPGNINQLVLANLFRDQSEPWADIARAHVKKSWETIREFVSLLMDHLADEHMSAVIIRTVIQPQLDRMHASLLGKVLELTAANKRGHALPLSRSFLRGHPLPLDRSFLARMQKSRNDRVLAHLQQSLPSSLPSNFSTTYNMGEIRAATQSMESSSNPFVASDLIDQFQAYYNNALGVFTDNITTLGIENCLLDPLNDLLTTRKITEMEDSQIEDLFAGVQNGVEDQGHDPGDELKLLQTAVRVLDQFKIAPSTGAIKSPGLSSAHGRSSLQPYLIPQGIICNGASANPFGVLCVDSRVQGQNNTPRYQISWPYSQAPDMQNSTTPCPSGPFGLNPGTMNPGTVSVPSVSAPTVNAAPTSGVPGFAGPTPPLPQTVTSSPFCSLRAGPDLFGTPDTSSHDA